MVGVPANSSNDGTQIPYFLVGHRSSSSRGPTLLAGYGCFGDANTPGYDGVLGRLWLALVAASRWRISAAAASSGRPGTTRPSAKNRHKVAEDFAAVAEDLVASGVTTAPQLGAMGGSAGGPADGHHVDAVF
jgi:prolyl oligopeptidase